LGLGSEGCEDEAGEERMMLVGGRTWERWRGGARDAGLA